MSLRRLARLALAWPACALRAALAGLQADALLDARALVVAPLTEEWVFRASVLPLLRLGGATPRAAVALTCAAFALAHAHHYRAHRAAGLPHGAALRAVLAQLSYTGVFGALEAALFLQAGSFAGIVLPHAFCNFVGVPSLAWLRAGAAVRAAVGAAFVAGIAACAWLLALGPEAALGLRAPPCALYSGALGF